MTCSDSWGKSSQSPEIRSQRSEAIRESLVFFLTLPIDPRSPIFRLPIPKLVTYNSEMNSRGRQSGGDHLH